MTNPHLRRFAVSCTGAAMACASVALATPAHAVTPPPPWQLGFIATTMVVSTDGGTVYAAALDNATDTVHVAAVDAATGNLIGGGDVDLAAATLDTAPADFIDSVALDPNGTVEVGAQWPGLPDPVTSEPGPEQYGVAPFDATTLVEGTVLPTNIAPQQLAVSDDGTVVATDGTAIETSTGAAIALPPVADGTTTEVQQLVARHGVIVARGDTYDLNNDTPTPAIWSGPISGPVLTSTSVGTGFQTWNMAIAADGTGYVGELKDNGPDADASYQVQVVGGTADGTVIPVDDITHLALAHGDGSLYAGDQNIDLADPTHPVSVSWPQYGDVIAVGDTAVYATPQLSSDATTESIVKLTAPAPVAAPTVDAFGDGTAAVQFTAPAEASDDPAYVTYTVTAQPMVDGAPTGDAVQSTDVSSDGTAWTAQFYGATALTPGTTYSFSVRADNGAFVTEGTPVVQQVPAFVPGSGSATITGTATVGNTLGTTVSGFQGDGISYTYEWDTVVVGGEWADTTPIPGATGSTLLLTAALTGKKVTVGITAHRDGYLPTTVWSTAVQVSAAPSTPPGNGPVTGPAPQHLGSVTAPPLKAGSKKVTLVLGGIGTLPGKVKVYDGKKLLGTATVTDGKLVLKLHKPLAQGKHHLKLSYAGSADADAFTKPVSLKVK